VPERCLVELEARSLDHRKAGGLASEIVDALAAAAGDHECDLETEVEELFRGYRLGRASPVLEVAEAALRRCGIEPLPMASGGASDANVLNAHGLPCLNMANGSEGNHEPDERVTVAALEVMLDVCLFLLEEAAAR
jgi:tripeptide aminopeptidase